MKKNFQRVLLGLAIVLLCLGIGFGVYVSDAYSAGNTASNILNETTTKKEQNWLALETDQKDYGLIYYPGGKVEYTAYLPLMKLLQQNGINCYLVKMPFNLAFFGSNRADAVIAAHPEIRNWYMGGHSLGGAFASAYASKHQEQIAGLLLNGAYVYGDYPIDRSITIYGSADNVLDRSKITYKDSIYVIQGGNHAEFGDYGKQDGDGTAAISPKEQWEQAARLMTDFILS